MLSAHAYVVGGIEFRAPSHLFKGLYLLCMYIAYRKESGQTKSMPLKLLSCKAEVAGRMECS